MRRISFMILFVLFMISPAIAGEIRYKAKVQNCAKEGVCFADQDMQNLPFKRPGLNPKNTC